MTEHTVIFPQIYILYDVHMHILVHMHIHAADIRCLYFLNTCVKSCESYILYFCIELNGYVVNEFQQ